MGNGYFGVRGGLASYVCEENSGIGLGVREDLGAEIEDFLAFGIEGSEEKDSRM